MGLDVHADVHMAVSVGLGVGVDVSVAVTVGVDVAFDVGVAAAERVDVCVNLGLVMGVDVDLGVLQFSNCFRAMSSSNLRFSTTLFCCSNLSLRAATCAA